MEIIDLVNRKATSKNQMKLIDNDKLDYEKKLEVLVNWIIFQPGNFFAGCTYTMVRGIRLDKLAVMAKDIQKADLKVWQVAGQYLELVLAAKAEKKKTDTDKRKGKIEMLRELMKEANQENDDELYMHYAKKLQSLRERYIKTEFEDFIQEDKKKSKQKINS